MSLKGPQYRFILPLPVVDRTFQSSLSSSIANEQFRRGSGDSRGGSSRFKKRGRILSEFKVRWPPHLAIPDPPPYAREIGLRQSASSPRDHRLHVDGISSRILRLTPHRPPRQPPRPISPLPASASSPGRASRHVVLCIAVVLVVCIAVVAQATSPPAPP